MPLARALILDVDGVITDGTLRLAADGGQSKTIRFRDLDAITLARSAGLKIGLLTGENDALVDAVASYVAPDAIIVGAKDKLAGVRDICARLEVELDQACYVGDADRDAAAISVVGIGMAPADGTAKARAAARYVLKAAGGSGLVEEVVEILLKEATPRPMVEPVEIGEAGAEIARLIQKSLIESARVKTEFSEGQSDNVARAARAIAGSLAQGGKVLSCGNGGSAADAQHFAGELVGRFLVERDPLPAIALSSDPSVVTAIGNDYGFDEIFARQVRAHAADGDVVVGFSTSGNSENVVKAFESAREIGATTIGFTGEGGGEMAALSDVLIAVPSIVTPRIQECHVAAMHALCEAMDILLGHQDQS